MRQTVFGSRGIPNYHTNHHLKSLMKRYTHKSRMPKFKSAFVPLDSTTSGPLDETANHLADQRNYFVYVIAREEIEACDTTRLLHHLRPELDNPLFASGPGSVVFMVQGYEHENRDLIVIPEFRAFARKAQQADPCWLYFELPGRTWLQGIFASSSDETLITETESPKLILGFSGKEVHQFLNPQIRSYRRICKLAKIDRDFAEIHLQVVIRDSFPNLPPLEALN